jgi:4a-hydroxytetrahydrobiopterin dehydratase
MTMPLSDDDLSSALARLSDWRLEDGALRKDFRFRDFVEAFGFLTRVALLAERQRHHPEVHNVYANVTLRLRTHDAGDRVTEADVALAEAIDRLG